MMKLGVWLPALGPRPETVVPMALVAEERGFDSVWVPDHVLQVIGPILDPLIVLAVIAGATRRVRLGVNVLVVPYRQPVVLANEIASLDRLATGRLLLGVGAGWNDAEFAAVGVPAGERGARTDEALRAMRELWRGGPATFAGRFVRFAEATLGTAPATPAGPPYYVGGYSDAALRRALDLGTAWTGHEDTPERIVEVRGRLARLGRESGRDAAALAIVTTVPLATPVGGGEARAEAAVEALVRLREAGVTLAILVLDPPTAEAVAWFAAEVVPRLG